MSVQQWSAEEANTLLLQETAGDFCYMLVMYSRGFCSLPVETRTASERVPLRHKPQWKSSNSTLDQLG